MAQLILKLRGREMQRRDITGTETRIGRDDTNDVAIDNPGVSRHHATVRWDGKQWFVTDEGSQNGLFVNGKKSDSWPLRDGDAIQVGKFEVVFSVRGGRDTAEFEDRNDPARARLRNPLATVALTADDIQRYMAEAGAKAAKPAAAPPEAQARRPSPAPMRISDDTPAEKGAGGYRNLAIALGVVVLALTGVMVWLLAFRE